MRKEIYLKNFNINSDDALNNFTKNPYKSTVFFKNFLETKYVNYTKALLRGYHPVIASSRRLCGNPENNKNATHFTGLLRQITL
ncbi:hypothetical protein [Rickettsia asembonensis]|uniref:hypothetical protein n=1 Tax=Rickettsia asembonensis TaxID=1068590 RepID=UPI000B33679A|nr:hypothetical protein [Rickettsia asembonensis]